MKMTAHGSIYALAWAVVTILLDAQICHGGSTDMVPKFDRAAWLRAAEQRARGFALVTDQGVAAPLNRFLLIRRDRDLCALRFTSFHTGQDPSGPPVVHAENEKEFAEYDWYYQGDGTGNLLAPTASHGHRRLGFDPSIGHGQFRSHPGPTHIQCSQTELAWLYPNQVLFFSRSKLGKDTGVEMTPTKWTDIHGVDASDPRLTWYRMGTRRTSRHIPVDELWQ
jgi:hypothetical protein